MRKQFSPEVEKGRVTTGRYASQVGDTWGLFNLRCPSTRALLTILAADAAIWLKEGMPGTVWEHVSVSLKDRCPMWTEMAWVKSMFFESDECVVEYHPPQSSYVNRHEYTLHLWRPVGIDFPMPPKECV